MRNATCGLLALCLVIAIAGCKTISPEAKYQLGKEVDCSTAEYDIRILEGEKASVAKQALSGVRMVLPASAVMGILSRDYRNRVKVATGQYNKDIDEKIQEIKSSCGIP